MDAAPPQLSQASSPQRRGAPHPTAQPPRGSLHLSCSIKPRYLLIENPTLVQEKFTGVLPYLDFHSWGTRSLDKKMLAHGQGGPTRGPFAETQILAS